MRASRPLRLGVCTGQTRQFSTSRRLAAPPIKRRTRVIDLLPPEAPQPLPYPYQASQWYKQRDRGLYGGQMIQFGNSVTEKKVLKNPDISSRFWRPNRQVKNLYSRALGRYLRLRVTTKTLRTIEKVGGVDNYLAGTSVRRLQDLGPEGWNMRSVILRTKGFRKLRRDDEKLQRQAQKMDRLQAEWQEVLAARQATVELPEIESPEAPASETRDTGAIDDRLEQNVRDSISRTRRAARLPPDFDPRMYLTRWQALWLAMTSTFNPRTYLPTKWGGRNLKEYSRQYALRYGRNKPPS